MTEARLCVRCWMTKDKLEHEGNFKTFVLLHTDITAIYSSSVKDKVKEKSKEKKRQIVEKFEKNVAALRNTKGGYIIVHIDGQHDDDRNLEQFDECFSKRFEGLIENGQLYIHTCCRKWLSQNRLFKDHKGFVLIDVKKTECITTVDFNTKIRNDFENINPVCINVISLIRSPSLAEKEHCNHLELNLREGQELCDALYESRRVEHKSIRAEYDKVKNDVTSFVEYIWTNLKLKYNITSLSKVVEGGLFLVGISEVNRTVNGYKTKVPFVKGFELFVQPSALKQALQKKIQSNVCVLHSDSFQMPDDSLARITLHCVQANRPEKYVLEVAIDYVDGVVFYDKEGPRTYIMENGETKRMDREMWLQRMKTISISIID